MNALVLMKKLSELGDVFTIEEAQRQLRIDPKLLEYYSQNIK